MKTYVLMVAKVFPAMHPRAGENTFFKEKMLCGALYRDAKCHTIRGNYDRWKKAIDEINTGRAILSCRQWKGRPYLTKQEEFLQIKSRGIQSVLGIQKIKMVGYHIARDVFVDDTQLSIASIFDLSHNDGLNREDFESWFGKKPFEGCIIHFTRLRYPIPGHYEFEGQKYVYSKEELQASEEFYGM